MRKYIFGMVCALLCTLTTTAQDDVQRKMQIKLTSGQTVEYLTKDVENITFTEEDAPDPPTPAEFSVEFVQEELTSSSIRVKIKPNDPTKRYYVSRMMTQTYMKDANGNWFSDVDIIKTFVDDPDFAQSCHTGEFTVSANNLIPGAKLSFHVFDAAAQVGAGGNVAALKGFKSFNFGFTVPSGDKVEDQFTITNTALGYTDASFHVVADDPSQTFVTYVFEKSYVDSKGEAVVQNCMFAINNDAVEKLMTISEYVAAYGKKIDGDFSFSGLKENTEYSILAFYVDPTNNDPTAVYDWNYTRLDFTTKKAEEGVGLEVSEVTKTVDASGYVTISCRIKTTDATKIIGVPKLASATEPYLGEDWESWGDLFVGGFGQYPASEREAMNSPEGYVKTWVGLDPGDYYVLVRAYNSQGKTKTVAVKVE